MTIVTAVKVQDGLILGTDSMTTISTSDGSVIKSYTNARKLFYVGDIGVMTWGVGNIGNRSIEGVVNDFALSGALQSADSVEATAHALADYVRPLYGDEYQDVQAPAAEDHAGEQNGDEVDEPPPALGFLIAGFSAGRPLAEEYEFVLPRDSEPFMLRDPDDLGAVWRGITAPFTRLAFGLDPFIAGALVEAGVSEEDLKSLQTEAGMIVSFAGMPLQDAINYATFVLDTTIGWATFQIGPASCSRPIQMALIRPGSGFEWISEPALSLPH